MSERLSADDLRARLSGLRPPNPLDMPGGGAPDLDTTPPVPQRDLVSSTLDAYRNAPAPRAGFRKGVAAAEATAPAPRPSGPPPKPNRYGGACVDCGGYVQAEAGALARTDKGWGAKHLVCPAAGDPVAEAVRAVEAVQDVPPGFVKITATTGQVYVGLQPGVYTLETGGGHRTFRVRVQSTDEDFAPGKTILEYLSGPDNERDYTPFAFLNGVRLAVWKKHQDNEVLITDAREFLADPSRALLAAKCIRCNRNLSTPESIRTMMGPDCREKGW